MRQTWYQATLDASGEGLGNYWMRRVNLVARGVVTWIEGADEVRLAWRVSDILCRLESLSNSSG